MATPSPECQFVSAQPPVRWADKTKYADRSQAKRCEAHREAIVQYYAEHSLVQTRAFINSDLGIQISAVQLRGLLEKKWGISKYQKLDASSRHCTKSGPVQSYNDVPSSDTSVDLSVARNRVGAKRTPSRSSSLSITKPPPKRPRDLAYKSARSESTRVEIEGVKDLSLAIDGMIKETYEAHVDTLLYGYDSLQANTRLVDQELAAFKGANTIHTGNLESHDFSQLPSCFCSPENCLSSGLDQGRLKPRVGTERVPSLTDLSSPPSPDLTPAPLFAGSRRKTTSAGNEGLVQPSNLHLLSQLVYGGPISVDLQPPPNPQDTTIRISVTSDPRSYSGEELQLINTTADFLFTCGLRRDSFPLYLSIWMQKEPSWKGRPGEDPFIQCVRSMCTKEHFTIMLPLIDEELRAHQGEDQRGGHAPLDKKAGRVVTCLLLFAAARIDNTTPKSGGRLKSAVDLLSILGEEAFKLDPHMFTPCDSRIASSNQVRAALLEEIIYITGSQSFEKESSRILGRTMINPNGTSNAAIALSTTAIRVLLAKKQRTTELASWDLQVLLQWLSTTLDELESRDPRSEYPDDPASDTQKFFAYIWHKWQVSSLTPGNLAIRVQHVLSTITPELLYALSNILVAKPHSSNSNVDFVVLIKTARRRLPRLLNLFDNLASMQNLFAMIYDEMIAAMRDRINSGSNLQVKDITKRDSIRKFVQRNQKIHLPETPLASPEEDTENSSDEFEFYSNPALAQSMHPSESSSYRRFFNCAASMMSHRTQTLSTYSSFLRTFAVTQGLNRTQSMVDKLSVSLQSLHLLDSRDDASLERNGAPMAIEAEESD